MYVPMVKKNKKREKFYIICFIEDLSLEFEKYIMTIVL